MEIYVEQISQTCKRYFGHKTLQRIACKNFVNRNLFNNEKILQAQYKKKMSLIGKLLLESVRMLESEHGCVRVRRKRTEITSYTKGAASSSTPRSLR